SRSRTGRTGGGRRVHDEAVQPARAARTRPGAARVARVTDSLAVSSSEARRIAVRAQLLDGSARGVLDTVRKLGFLQMDPIATVARPQELVLFSRLGPFDVAQLDRLLWQKRKLFEYDAFIYPVEDLPLQRARMARRR